MSALDHPEIRNDPGEEVLRCNDIDTSSDDHNGLLIL